MRLIDADEFFKNFPELAIEPYINVPTIIWCSETSDGLPLMDLRPRPQGEWIEVKPHQSDLEDGIDYREECSICHEPNRHYGFDEYHNIKSATYYKTKYCPNCGADMRGKADQLRDCENCIHHSDNGCEVWKCEFEKRSGL